MAVTDKAEKTEAERFQKRKLKLQEDAYVGESATEEET